MILTWLAGLIRRRDCRQVRQWLTDLEFELLDGQRHLLTAGPRVDQNLKQVWSSGEVAAAYLKHSPVFVFTNSGELIFRNQIKAITSTNRQAISTWCRWIWLGIFRTRWRRQLDKTVVIS